MVRSIRDTVSPDTERTEPSDKQFATIKKYKLVACGPAALDDADIVFDDPSALITEEAQDCCCNEQHQAFKQMSCSQEPVCS
jgi:hypothetical protein